MKRNRRSTKKSATHLLTILISIFIVGTASAAWVPLTGDLIPVSSIPTGGLQVGDKLFTEFDVTAIGAGGAHPPTADSVLLQGGQDSVTGNYGLRFRLAWIAGSEQTVNADINFKVSILPDYEPWFIKDAVLFLATTGATGNGAVNACENIYDADFLGNSLAVLSSSVQANSAHLIDHRQLCLQGNPTQVKEIWVRTGITIAGGDVGTANLSEVFMLYSQIPEPATMLLLGLGSLALLRIRKR